MRKFLVVLLAATFVLGMAAVAYAADPAEDTPFTFIESPGNTPPGAEYNPAIPSSFGEPGFPTSWQLSGASQWAYKDTFDATRKLEGSYRAFDDQTNNLYDAGAGRDSGPHGGYGTTTNKCKTCHAVHRASGAFALLRVDSADEACSYCHIGDHRHSVVSAYWRSGGIHPANGHTIGAGKKIPDSSLWQWIEEKTLTSVAEGEDAGSQVINVRRYDTRRNKIMRYIVHGGRFIRVGPMYLRCMSCHQTHNASKQIWKPYNSAGVAMTNGYKLLRNSPSGGIKKLTSAMTTSRETFGYWDPESDLEVIPAGTQDGKIDTATGVNFSGATPAANKAKDYFRLKVIDSTFTETTNQGVTAGVITDMTKGAGSPNTTGYTRWKYFADGASYADYSLGGSKAPTPGIRVEEASMAFWCADCHNLNIAGKDKVATNWGTGRRNYTMLSDRSHAVPMNIRKGLGTEQGSQCYSCHNSDMPYMNGAQTYTVAASGNDGSGSVSLTAAQADCGACHISATMYRAYKQTYRTFMGVAGGNSLSDWPHAGPDDGYKLLNAVTAIGFTNDLANPGDPYDYRTPFRPATDGLDKVCKICHGPQGSREIGVDK